MPLKLEMKMGDKIIINGAVLEVATPHTKLIIHNHASILRGKEILSEEQAITPATRVYYALQNAYLFHEHRDRYLDEFRIYIEQYLVACPSATEIVKKIVEMIADGKLYKALKAAQELIAHQQGVLHEFEEQLLQLSEIDDIEEEFEEELEARKSKLVEHEKS